MSLLNISRTSELKAPSGKFMKQCAFTLAEVLITLGIIGVVAALTIPTLVQNSQKTQYVTAYKKGYSLITQAFTGLAKDYGCVGNLSCTGLYMTNTQAGSESLVNALKDNIKIIKNCGGAGTDCFSKTIKYLNATGGQTLGTDVATFVTADGAAFGIRNLGANSGNATIFLDTNGLKKPNQYGRDVFIFYLLNNGTIKAHGGFSGEWKNTADIWNNCITDNTSNGLGCSAKIIDEGWQMNY